MKPFCKIRTVYHCKSTLFLNNVTDAKVASVANSNLTSSSGKLTIDKVSNNVAIDLSFGDVLISSFNSTLKNFKMNLKQSEASINVKGLNDVITHSADTVITNKKDSSYTFKGSFLLKMADQVMNIEGKYSKIEIIK